MVLRPPRSTLPHTPFPYRPLFRSALRGPISYSCRAREFLESADDRALVIELAISTTRFRRAVAKSEEHTSELQSLMRISYAVFCLKKKNKQQTQRYKQYTKQQ